jgi:hypothetical protein
MLREADDLIMELERDLDFELTAHRFKGEWYEDCPQVRAALERLDRGFNPERYAVPLDFLAGTQLASEDFK